MKFYKNNQANEADALLKKFEYEYVKILSPATLLLERFIVNMKPNSFLDNKLNTEYKKKYDEAQTARDKLKIIQDYIKQNSTTPEKSITPIEVAWNKAVEYAEKNPNSSEGKAWENIKKMDAIKDATSLKKQ